MNKSDDENDVTPEERAAAKRLGDALDGVFAGGAAPPAMDVDERELLELATAIHGAELAPATGVDVSSMLDGLLGPAAEPRRSRRNAALPWAIATIAAAAALVLYLRGPKRVDTLSASSHQRPPESVFLPSANRLIGPIERPASADARARIDTIYAAGLSRYRERAFAQKWRER